VPIENYIEDLMKVGHLLKPFNSEAIYEPPPQTLVARTKRFYYIGIVPSHFYRNSKTL
jgi:hypothetical protein